MDRQVKETEDGSFTLYSKDCAQHYHSPRGARLEAEEKFVKPCTLERYQDLPVLRLLDICFGLGYNSAAAIDYIKNHHMTLPVEIIGLEIDKTLLPDATTIPFPFSCTTLFEQLRKSYDNKRRVFFAQEENISLQVFIGDARIRLDEVGGDFAAVFLDPFSLNKAPELWQQDFLDKIAKRCLPGSTLTTYSCARKVRERLINAGFEVRDGPILFRRGPSSVARRLG